MPTKIAFLVVLSILGVSSLYNLISNIRIVTPTKLASGV
jgi:hypothetical protein